MKKMKWNSNESRQNSNEETKWWRNNEMWKINNDNENNDK